MSSVTQIKKELPKMTIQSYPKVAFVSAVTPATAEHYSYLEQAGIKTVSVCLHVSGFNHYKFAHMHTNLARAAGMVTHAHMVTDLVDTFTDLTSFTTRFNQLGYSSNSKITIWVNGDKYIDNREDKINKIIDMMSNYHDRRNIDVAFFKRDLDDGLYKLDKIPKMINLTIINVDKLHSGVPEAGTWVYTSSFCESVQLLAYDYYGFYTSNGYQLSLVDSDYVVQPGDTWHSISRRHGIPLIDLLQMNRAESSDAIYAGQVVRIA